VNASLASPLGAPAQLTLTEELRRIRGYFQTLNPEAVEATNPVAEGSNAASAATERATAAGLDAIVTTFGLTPFERDLLLLCAGVELDDGLSALCAAAQGDARRGAPTFALALALLPEAHWSATTPAGALRAFQLLEVMEGARLLQAPLRISERVLHELLGVGYLDEPLLGCVRALPAPEALAPSQAAAARRVAALWQERPPLPAVLLCGGDPGTRAAIASAAGAQLGLRILGLAASDLPTAPSERAKLLRLWQREALLSGSALLLEYDDWESARAATSFAEHMPLPLLLGGPEPIALEQRVAVRVDVHKPTRDEQRALFKAALGPQSESLEEPIERVVAQFDLGTNAISAVALAATRAASAANGDCGARLWEACRSQARPRLQDLALRLDAVASWDDLVLSEGQSRALRDIAGQVRQRVRVYEHWGFASKGSLGHGVSVLFAGPSGTGKTMAAEVLAGELGLDLYRVDLSRVVSKYIGETEKNLRRIFDAAEQGGAVLLFDEADALFGKRSEVRDSHDRHANIEVSYLLQRVELYRGLAILTTNMKEALDQAFLRRLRFLVQFPAPDQAQRTQIWRHVFPARTPLEGIDLGKLSRLNVTGGSIRNIALSAAFLAAEQDEPVRMTHLLRAARVEYAKLERSLTEHEVGGWT